MKNPIDCIGEVNGPYTEILVYIFKTCFFSCYLMFLSTNIYFNVKLLIKNTQYGLYDEYGDVEIDLRASLIDKLRSAGVADILVGYEHSMTV